jgi:hypothetical protein
MYNIPFYTYVSMDIRADIHIYIYIFIYIRTCTCSSWSGWRWDREQSQESQDSDSDSDSGIHSWTWWSRKLSVWAPWVCVRASVCLSVSCPWSVQGFLSLPLFVTVCLSVCLSHPDASFCLFRSLSLCVWTHSTSDAHIHTQIFYPPPPDIYQYLMHTFTHRSSTLRLLIYINIWCTHSHTDLLPSASW